MMAALMDATAADMTAAEATATAVTMTAAAKDWLSLCNTGAQRARQCCLNTQGQAFGACGRRDYAFERRCAHLWWSGCERGGGQVGEGCDNSCFEVRAVHEAIEVEVSL